MSAGYELFDHTADLGLRIWAPSRQELLPQAAQALYAAIGELIAGGSPQPSQIACSASEPAILLRDFLNELLILFDRDQRMATTIVVQEFAENNLRAALTTVQIDPQHSVLLREVKAVTYHQLHLTEGPKGLQATVIVDI